MKSVEHHPRVVMFAGGGRNRAARIEPDRYVASRLIAELADAWKGYAETASLTPGTVVRQACVTRKLGDYLTLDADRFLTMSGDGAAVARRLHNWESAMVATFPPPSVRAKDLGIELRNQVHRYLLSNGISEGVLMDWANGNVLDGSPLQALPLDEFSNSERLDLVRTCRQIVRDTEDRLALGDALLREGGDPRIQGWDRVPNVLWALRNLPYEAEFHSHLVGKGRQIDLLELPGVSAVERGRKLPPMLAALGILLVPGPQYQLAIRVLFHLRTGWAPEETGGLHRRDIEFDTDVVRVRAMKARAQRVRWHSLPSPQSDSWGWKAGDLLRRANHALRHAHAISPDEPRFWVVGCRTTTSERKANEYPHFVIRPNKFHLRLSQLIENHGLSISEPHDMRRLRKTVKSAKAALLGTLAGGAGDDHSVEVFRGHYAQTTTVHTIAAQTVLRAQQKVVEHASQGPTFVDASAGEIAALPAASGLRDVAAAVVAETPTEKMLTITACRDPHDGPVTEAGMLCHASPSMCLQCRNAIVFRDHLPRLIAYQGALEAIAKNTHPTVFNEVYGQQRVNLEAILATFPAEQVDAARNIGTDLHRPLGERAEL